jgi:hypothetical protein
MLKPLEREISHSPLASFFLLFSFYFSFFFLLLQTKRATLLSLFMTLLYRWMVSVVDSLSLSLPPAHFTPHKLLLPYLSPNLLASKHDHCHRASGDFSSACMIKVVNFLIKGLECVFHALLAWVIDPVNSSGVRTSSLLNKRLALFCESMFLDLAWQRSCEFIKKLNFFI